MPLARVFLSYSSRDREAAYGLFKLLESLDFQVFFDQASIRAGDDWEAKILERLGASDKLVVLWTLGASSSDWVKREIERWTSLDTGRKLVTVKADDTPLPPSIARYQFVGAIPLLDGLFAKKLRLEREGVGRVEIEALLARDLRARGIKLKPEDERRVVKALLTTTGTFTLGATVSALWARLTGAWLRAASAAHGSTPGLGALTAVAAIAATIVVLALNSAQPPGPAPIPAEPPAPVTTLGSLVSPSATIKVVSIPPNASVFIDDVFAGLAPLTVQRKPGLHDVVIGLAGYATEHRRVDIAAGSTVPVEVSLSVHRGTSVDVNVAPDDAARAATVRIDGWPGRVGSRGPIAAGPHFIRVEADGYRIAERAIVVEEGTDQTVTLVLEPLPATLSLSVNVAAECDVAKEHATATPGSPLVFKFDPGPVHVRCTARGYDTAEIELNLEPGRTHSKRVTLKASFAEQAHLDVDASKPGKLVKPGILAEFDRVCGVRIVVTPNGQSVSAALNEDERVIYVDPGVMGEWTMSRLFMFAHECGHHKMAHGVPQGRWFENTSTWATQRQELEADCWAAKQLADLSMEDDLRKLLEQFAREGQGPRSLYPSRVDRAMTLAQCAGIQLALQQSQAISAAQRGLPSGSMIKPCGCWGPNLAPAASEARCASGIAVAVACSGLCAPWQPALGYFCR